MVKIFMKKVLLLVVVLVLVALAALGYWCEPARNAVLQGWGDYVVPAWDVVKSKTCALVAKEKPQAETPVAAETAEPAEVAQPEPQPVPVADTSATPAEIPVSEPADELVTEPTPEPEPVKPEPLPALNAEAESLLPRAEAGDAVAQFNLARQYALGEGMAINRDEFIRWCRTAADQGLPEAQYALGCCYLRGLIVEKNEAEARRLLEAAAESGFAPATDALKE